MRGQPAVILVNLVAGNAAEADLLAYHILVAAISLGRESIPAVLAVYNNREVVMVSASLSDRQLVSKALQIVKEIVVVPPMRRYLKPPDILRLKTNLNRLRQVESHSAGVLRELLGIEYKNVAEESRTNPVTLALTRALAGVSQQSSIVTLSHRNHDAAALAFNSYNLSQKGAAVINLDLSKSPDGRPVHHPATNN